MSRSLWFVAGAGAGVYAAARARRVAEALTADGLRDRWGAWSLGARMFREEVAAGSAERETDLRRRYGLAPDGTPQLASVVEEALQPSRHPLVEEAQQPSRHHRTPGTGGFETGARAPSSTTEGARAPSPTTEPDTAHQEGRS